MNILVVGDTPSQAEFKSKFRDHHPTVYKFSGDITPDDLQQAQLVFDFCMDAWPHGKLYQAKGHYSLLVNSVKTTLLDLKSSFQWPTLIGGFCGLPGLFDRGMLELTKAEGIEKSLIERICQDLGSSWTLVDDRVGMVTARVWCMIINEAYYTVQERTARISDIDEAMKLGTRYPYGPFEFCKIIGIRHVYEILEALYQDTHEERYKICPLLKKDYLRETKNP